MSQRRTSVDLQRLWNMLFEQKWGKCGFNVQVCKNIHPIALLRCNVQRRRLDRGSDVWVMRFFWCKNQRLPLIHTKNFKQDVVFKNKLNQLKILNELGTVCTWRMNDNPKSINTTFSWSSVSTKFRQAISLCIILCSCKCFNTDAIWVMNVSLVLISKFPETKRVV